MTTKWIRFCYVNSANGGYAKCLNVICDNDDFFPLSLRSHTICDQNAKVLDLCVGKSDSKSNGYVRR